MALPSAAIDPCRMTMIDPLPMTIRYLRFPLAEDHRTPVQDGSVCPHCQQKRVQKWGRFSGRQRYRCRECGRTFSTFTGTALHHLKRPDRWRRFLWCVDGRLTVRSSAAVLGVDKNTALRWRHRLLDQWRRESRARLRGRITVGSFFVPHSDKGQRLLMRPARKRGAPWAVPSLMAHPEVVLVAAEAPAGSRSRARIFIRHVGGGRLLPEHYDQHLTPNLREVTAIIGCRGPLSPAGHLARRIGAPYDLERPPTFFPRQVFLVRREVRAWLRPFRGVATRNLNNYLEWFRRRGFPRSRAPTTPAYRAIKTPRKVEPPGGSGSCGCGRSGAGPSSPP